MGSSTSLFRRPRGRHLLRYSCVLGGMDMATQTRGEMQHWVLGGVQPVPQLWIQTTKILCMHDKKTSGGVINKKFLTCQLLTEIFCQALTEFEIFCQDLTEFEIFCQGLTDIFCQGLTEFFGLFMWSADRFFSVKCWQIFFFKQQSLLTDFWASWQILDSLDRNFLSRGVQLTPLFDLKYQLGV